MQVVELEAFVLVAPRFPLPPHTNSGTEAFNRHYDYVFKGLHKIILNSTNMLLWFISMLSEWDAIVCFPGVSNYVERWVGIVRRLIFSLGFQVTNVLFACFHMISVSLFYIFWRCSFDGCQEQRLRMKDVKFVNRDLNNAEGSVLLLCQINTSLKGIQI